MAETDRQVFAICVGAAFIFWLILNLSQDYTISREVELTYLVDPERVLISEMPGDIETDLTGSGWSLIWESLRPGPVRVTVDVRDPDRSRLSRDELQQQIRRSLSSGSIRVDYLDFESVPILTTPLAGKRVPIRSNITVQPQAGFLIVDSLYLSPDSVTINAANDVLDTIESWATTPLDIAALNGRAEAQINLVKPKQGITLGNRDVLFSVRSEPFIERIINVPITVVNAPAGQRYELTPATVDIKVSLPQSAFDRVTAQEFRVVADVGTMRDGSFSPSLPLVLVEQPKEVVSAFLALGVVTYYGMQ